MTAPAETPIADTVLDTRGLYCPEPIMLLHNKIRAIESGQVIEVQATDPATQRDIPKFCQFLSHELIYQEEQTSAERLYRYFIRKG